MRGGLQLVKVKEFIAVRAPDRVLKQEPVGIVLFYKTYRK